MIIGIHFGCLGSPRLVVGACGSSLGPWEDICRASGTTSVLWVQFQRSFQEQTRLSSSLIYAHQRIPLTTTTRCTLIAKLFLDLKIMKNNGVLGSFLGFWALCYILVGGPGIGRWKQSRFVRSHALLPRCWGEQSAGLTAKVQAGSATFGNQHGSL